MYHIIILFYTRKIFLTNRRYMSSSLSPHYTISTVLVKLGYRCQVRFTFNDGTLRPSRLPPHNYLLLSVILLPFSPIRIHRLPWTRSLPSTSDPTRGSKTEPTQEFNENDVNHK